MQDKLTSAAETCREPSSAGVDACVVIPCYNHGQMMASVLQRIAPFKLHCFIIDDGSDAPTQQALQRLSQQPEVTLVRLAQNQGKGGAVIAGIQAAAAKGYTHAIQVDADGQHQIEDIPRLLALSCAYPGALVSGRPQYDESVPRSRLYGRYVTHFWVWVETLSLSVVDSMCGFRVYPVVPVLKLVQRSVHIGRRMDFDTEIMVRLYWAGTPSLFVQTRVTYPEDGVSHFDVLRDNVRISWMHTRLFFGMLPRMPKLLWRNLRRKQWRQQAQHHSLHWSEVAERKGLWGMRCMLWAYRVFGRGFFYVLLYPVVAVFWLAGRQQRESSELYLQRLRDTAARRGVELPAGLTSYQHMLRFADAMLDKVASWRGDIQMGRDIDWAADTPLRFSSDQVPAMIILASHLGDIEVCRALSQSQSNLKVNALVFNAHAERFRQVMKAYAPNSAMNLISVTNIGPQTAVMLKEKVDAGECVAIVGDRTSVGPLEQGGKHRVIWSEFLGQKAPFAQGPFVLASLLRCPVMMMFALKEDGKLRIYCEHFSDKVVVPRGSREQALQDIVDRYAQRLEHYCLRFPLEWFNFFDFWHLPDTGAASAEAPQAGKVRKTDADKRSDGETTEDRE